MASILIELENKELTYETCPQYPGQTPPIVFDEPIHIVMQYEVSYKEIAAPHKEYLYEYLIEADASGYPSNSQYPSFRCGNDWNNNLLFGWNLSPFGTLSNVSGLYKYYLNGALQQSVTITGSNINTYNSLSRNISMFENFHLKIQHCTIPVIYDVYGDALHGYNPDIYFKSQWDLLTISSGYDINKCLNMLTDIEAPDSTEYFYYGVANKISVNNYGESSQLDFPTLNRGFRLKIPEGRVSFYVQDGIENDALWFNINIGDTPLVAYYSYDCDVNGNGTWQEMEYAPTTLPFSKVYRWSEKEIGEYYCAGPSKPFKTLNTNIPIYGTQEESDLYNSTGEGLENAINYNEISNYYDIDNPTGIEDDLTEFGENYTRSFFTQCYLCNTGAVQEISNNLFDYDVTTLSGIWENIKKGLEMYGTNPMEVVQGLRFYPFDLSQIFSSTQSQNYIYFGAYQLQLQSSSVYKVIYANGYKDLGTVSVRRTFNDWRDFEPYTKLSIYLPYIGRYPLKAERYYGKQVNIRYYIDIRTGLACACLIADGVLLDWFDGQIGTEMPITLTDYASYSQTQINTILRNATIGIGAEGMAGNVIVKGVKNALNYNQNAQAVQEAALMSPSTSSLSAQTAGSYGTQALVGTGIASGALVGGIAVGTAMKTGFDLMKTGTAANTSVKGSSSSMINSFLPQYPTFMFEILEIDESPYLNELYGRPSNASGRIADFSGYLEAEDIMLICPIATDSERQEIIDLVRSGIYI